MITMEKVCKSYKVAKRNAGFREACKALFHREYEEIQALKDISFTIRDGEMVGYIGPNGAGKSSTIKILSGILTPDSGKVTKTEDFVFYGNLKHPSGCAEHMGDNLTGEGEGDDEQIEVDLTKIPANVEKIAFTVTIYDAEVRRQNFGQVSNAFIRIVDEVSGKELIHYDLGEDFSIETAVVVGEMYRHNGEWKFNAIGSGFHGGLAALCGHYGIEVA